MLIFVVAGLVIAFELWALEGTWQTWRAVRRGPVERDDLADLTGILDPLELERRFGPSDDQGRGAPLHPVRWMLRHPLDSLARAPELRSSTLVVHSVEDDLIDVDHGRALAAAIPGATYVEMPQGRHNEFSSMRDDDMRRRLAAFLDAEIPASRR